MSVYARTTYRMYCNGTTERLGKTSTCFKCDPRDPWYCGCGNEQCPCWADADESDED